VSNIFTTPGGFQPTPSTCYKWPPYTPGNWPIPCLQGPVPSLVFIETTIEFRHTIVTINPNRLTATATGIAQFYSAPQWSGLVGHMANGSLLDFNCKLLCGPISPGIIGWAAQVDGKWLTPQGHVMPFWTILGAQLIDDLSIAGNYNLITSTDLPNDTPADGWFVQSQKTSWYTQGAPH
jgi:hypothetical protein